MELINLVNSVIIFLSQMVLLRWLTFLLGSQTVILTVLLFWIYFVLLMLVFVLQWLPLHWEILIMLLSQFPLTFHQQDAPFHCIAYDYSHTDWDSLLDYLRDAPWQDIVKLSASAGLLNFVSEFRLELMCQKYHIKSHPSQWSSAACAAAIVHKNHFFCLSLQNKSSESKVNFRQASNHCKRALEAAKLVYANKTKESITSQKLGFPGTFGKFSTVFSTERNLLYLLYSVTRRCCLLHLIKQNCMLKTFLKPPILMTHVSLYLFSLLELIWNCIIFL